MISVDSGRWKFVISASITLNLYPGYMKIPVSISPERTVPSSCAMDSRVRQEVVPTATMRPPFFFVSLISLAVASLIMQCSTCM